MTPASKTAVLIHGYHLHADEWEHLVWGEPAQDVLGSIPRGVLEAYRSSADVIFWGTGAGSEKNGVRESQFIFDLALSRVEVLAKVCDTDAETMYAFLTERSHIDTNAKNTVEEITAFFEVCLSNDITRAALVAAATHAPRSTKTALSVLHNDSRFRSLRHSFYSVPAGTSFANATIDDVAIFEPPHRGDQTKWQTYRYVRAILGILLQGESVFETFLNDFGVLLKKYGVTVDWPTKK